MVYNENVYTFARIVHRQIKNNVLTMYCLLVYFILSLQSYQHEFCSQTIQQSLYTYFHI